MKIVGNRLMKERLSKEDKLLKVQMWRDWIAMRADSIRSLLNKTKQITCSDCTKPVNRATFERHILKQGCTNRDLRVLQRWWLEN